MKREGHPMWCVPDNRSVKNYSATAKPTPSSTKVDRILLKHQDELELKYVFKSMILKVAIM